MSLKFLPPPIEPIYQPIAHSQNIELSALRLDLIHPWINGNKWFKLKYNLSTAKSQKSPTILTFGGAYSNHIFATAAAGNLFGLNTIGVIRGEERLPLNPTLTFARKMGMSLVYLDRERYRQRQSRELQEQLQTAFPGVFMIPEGGCNFDGIRGCTEIIPESGNFNIICVACGTATTLVGIALSLASQQKVIGFPVLKGGKFLESDIDHLSKNYLSSGLPAPRNSLAPWELFFDYHFGGYGKIKDELCLFCQDFTKKQGIPLDYIYTGKMFYGVMDLLQKGFFRSGDRILLIHTGGLQGMRSPEKTAEI
jgi:1-aminocyclopropane-1-carboxylate deaminase